jgi:putative hydrolase of HD superfamily
MEPYEPANKADVQGLINFLKIAGRLKSTARTGWVDRGLSRAQAESVADHSFRVALMAWLAAAYSPGLNRDRVLILALCHDLAEALTGDETPYGPEIVANLDDRERASFFNQRHIRDIDRSTAKRFAESNAIATMTSELASLQRDEIAAIWRELEERSTPEARFVKQIDKLETYLQSLEYKSEHAGLPVESFAAEVSEVIEDPYLIAIRDALQD